MIGAIEFQGIDELAALWKRAPEIARREMLSAMESADTLLRNAVREKTPEGKVGDGLLRQSIESVAPEVNGQTIIGVVGTPAPYAVPVELGTKPHWPKFTPGPDGVLHCYPLEDWVVNKLGVSEKEAKGVAFLVARKISRTGTKAAHMFRDGFADNTDRVQAIFERARDRIRNQLAAAGTGGVA